MEEDEILRIHSILHLIFHRNKNQHGRTKWWKWLSILKRTVWNFALSLSLSDRGGDLRSSAEFYKQYLASRVVPRCYVEFSVVVADAQFSTLGTVLLATLARLAKATGIDKELKSRPSIETVRGDVSLPHVKISKGKEDVGQALARNGETSDFLGSEPQQTPQPASVDSGRATSSKSSVLKELGTAKPRKKKKKKKKKKQKKQNTIDDLFDGLL